MTAAAFRATYADWKVIKGRKVVQIVFELPLEHADQAYQVLGGMPIAASEIWCAIARLKNEGEAASQQQGEQAGEARQDARPGGGNGAASRNSVVRAPRRFKDLPYAQQAALRCNEPVFWAFLREVMAYEPSSADDAAEAVRERCDVGSRSEIKAGTEAGIRWERINDQFEAWKAAEGAFT